MRRAGYRVDDALERALRERTEIAVNRSEHRPYTDYYDERSRRLVARRSALLIGSTGARSAPDVVQGSVTAVCGGGLCDSVMS